MKKVAVYLRVSTSEQTTQNQMLAIERYAKLQNWTVGKVYEDAGVSGATYSRPALDTLKNDCAKGKFSVLVVWKFDRLARSTSHLLETLELLQRHGCDFVSVTEAIDTTTPAGRMVLTFLGAIAEFEREIIRERVKAGLQRAKENGQRLGRPRVGFDVNEALSLKKSGLSWAQLSRKMDVSVSTLRRSLTPLLKNHG